MDYGQNGAVYGHDEPQYDGRYDAEEGNYGSIDNVDVSAGVKHDSSSSAGKLFVGGIAWETSEESFSRYFRKYGEITDSVIMMDRISGRPRGFGFITFADAEVAENVLLEDHVIDGRAVEVKRTVPRENMQGRGGVLRTKKIFVGGLPLSLNEDDLREYFSSYGNIVDHQIMLDHTTGRSRGFGFITFENEDAVEKIFSDGQMHELNGKQVEIKRAEPKRPGFDHSTENRFHRGGSGSSKSSGNFSGGSEGFGGGYGSKMARGYGGYDAYGNFGAYGNFSGNYSGGAAGFYPGYGGYGYGYGFGGAMYNGGAYGGGGGYAAGPLGYGGAAGYGVAKGYGGPGGNGGGYGPAKGYGSGGGGGGGGYGGSKGYGNGNGNGTNGRFHPYRK